MIKRQSVPDIVGLLLGLGGMIIMLGLGLWAEPLYLGSGVALLLAILAVQMRRVARWQAQARQQIDPVFRDVYAGLLPTPALVTDFRYGFPAVKIVFRAKADMTASVLQNDTFKTAIQKTFENCGSKRRPFRAEKAVNFTYERLFRGVPGPLPDGLINRSS